MMKIVNQTTYTIYYQLFDYVTCTQVLGSGTVPPNNMDAWEFSAPPGDNQNAMFAYVSTQALDGNNQPTGTQIESVGVPANAVVTFSTQIFAGLAPTTPAMLKR
jgi:hypothetical protein